MLYNPNYIDDRDLEDILRLEREMTDDLKWRIEKELEDTRDMIDRVRETIRQLNDLR